MEETFTLRRRAEESHNGHAHQLDVSAAPTKQTFYARGGYTLPLRKIGTEPMRTDPLSRLMWRSRVIWPGNPLTSPRTDRL